MWHILYVSIDVEIAREHNYKNQWLIKSLKIHLLGWLLPLWRSTCSLLNIPPHLSLLIPLSNSYKTAALLWKKNIYMDNIRNSKENHPIPKYFLIPHFNALNFTIRYIIRPWNFSARTPWGLEIYIRRLEDVLCL